MGAQWKQKGRLASADAKGRVFTKLAKEITIAARNGADLDMNPRLRLAVEAAKKASMPRDTLERAIKKGAGLLDENSHVRDGRLRGLRAAPGAGDRRVPHRQQEPHRDQRARAVPQGPARDVGRGVLGLLARRHDRGGAAVGRRRRRPPPSRRARRTSSPPTTAAFRFYTDAADLDIVTRALTAQGWTVSSAFLGWRPKNPVAVSGAARDEVEAFLAALDDDDDVQQIYVGLSEA